MTNPSVTIHLELTPWQAAQLSEAVRLHKSHLISVWKDAGERVSVIAISAAEIQRMLTAINDEILKPDFPTLMEALQRSLADAKRKHEKEA